MALGEHPATEAGAYPLVRKARSGPSEDGNALLVDGATAEDAVVRFAVGLDEVQHFVAILLVEASRMSALQDEAPQVTNASRPIPATSVSFKVEGTEAHVGIGIGTVELVYAIPTVALEAIGRALMTASATPDFKRAT
jgi:hypothetical protein